ncbi:hypothetical protein EXIGLDRAFT_724370 [Exidia glandulosa HHB12029]|uniref:Uncharacterized protein n=1 Tax=Exidia glandulosa HHB12029 TaxID=1314781 RepID=A0A165EGA4_EXIGL|nr:hypothetical protein EXIGLDRAFT_724370 [Exidia glandulosa HHB12029]
MSGVNKHSGVSTLLASWFEFATSRHKREKGALSLDGHASLNAAQRARRTNKLLQLDTLNSTNNLNSAEDSSAHYCLISYSCGHILDDNQKVATYNLRPHELLELQRRNDAVYIPRPLYAKPYFDVAVFVLKVTERNRDDPFASDMTNRFSTIRGVTRVPSDGDIRAGKRAPKKTRAVPQRAPQWKERRLVLKDGQITIWRDRQDKEPVAAFDLAQLVALHSPDHAGLKLPCACADAAQCPVGAAVGCGRHVVCARFAPPPAAPVPRKRKEEPRVYPGSTTNEGDARMYLGVPFYTSATSLTDKKGSVRARARASTDADRRTESGSDAERKPDEMLVMRLPDERWFYHMLRTLHYADTNMPLSSTYVASPTKAQSPASVLSSGSSPSSSSPGFSASTHSTPTTATTSDMSPFPSLKLRKSARPTTLIEPAQVDCSSRTHRSLLYHDDHPALSISVRYPTWRTHILQRAEIAGKGRPEPPPEEQSDSEAEWDGWAYDFQCRLAKRLEQEPQHAQRLLQQQQQRQQHHKPPRVRSAESLRENRGTSISAMASPNLKGGGPKSPLRERILSGTSAEGKKRKLSISIFIPGAGGSGGSNSSAAERTPGRTRSASVASPVPSQSSSRAGPRRKPSAGTLFSPPPPPPHRLAHRTSNSTLDTAYETDGAEQQLRPSPLHAVLKKPRRSADTTGTSGSDRRVRSASVSLAGSRAGSPSTFGHNRSRAPSEDVQLQQPNTPTPTPTNNQTSTSSGFGRLVRGFSMRK